MANELHIQWLLEGVEAWNQRRDNWDYPPDLSGLDFFNRFENDGKLEDDGEIPLAGYNFDYAKLVGADLIGANLHNAKFLLSDLTDARLSEANLVDAMLLITNLTRARLTRANLGGANLATANLTGAWLDDANLTGANLTGANLTGANLTGANLTNAKLYGTILANAKLYGTILENASCQRVSFTGADLTGAKLWEAVIFDGADASPVQYQIEPKPIKSMKNLLAGIKEIKSCYQGSEEAVRLYFRGEAKSIHQLRPSAMRDEAFIENEGAMLTDLASRRPEEFNGLVSGLAQLVLAQHNGLKTRFLDISRNPLVALFHACGGGESSQKHSEHDGRMHVFVAPRQMVKPFNSDTVSVIANYARLPRRHQKALTGGPDAIGAYSTAMEQLVQLIQAEKCLISRPELTPEIFTASSSLSRNSHRNASGRSPGLSSYRLFTSGLSGIRFCIGMIRSRCMPITLSPCQRMIRTEILKDLRMFNITRETLFPGLDTAAEAIMQSYHQRQP